MIFGWMVMIFVLTPVIELALLLKVGELLGWERALILVIVTGVVGAGLARAQGLHALYAIQRSLSAGELPAAQLMDGVMILMAGLLLITPGLITDAIGFGLLIPFIRSAIRLQLRRKLEEKIRNGSANIRFWRGPES